MVTQVPMRIRVLGVTSLKYLILIAVLCLTSGPMLWVWLNSLRTSREFMRAPLGLPKHAVWQNFVDAWTIGHFGRYFVNSIIIAVPVVVAGVLSPQG